MLLRVGFALGWLAVGGALVSCSKSGDEPAVYRALGYQPQDFFQPYSRFRALANAGFEEAVAGTQAQGQQMLDQGVIGRPSLHVDLVRGNPTEVEFCLGPFLREAERLGIQVPTARAGYRIIRSLEQLLA